MFTGTREDGTGNQTSGQLGTVVAAGGLADTTDSRWINQGGSSSPTERRFYAISERLIAVPEPGAAGWAALLALEGLRRARIRGRRRTS